MVYNDRADMFTKTTFPAKVPTRRSQVTALQGTLDRMMEHIDAEEQRKETERTVRMAADEQASSKDGDDLDAIKKRAAMRVQHESQGVMVKIGRMEAEEGALLTVFGELGRQVAVGSKDRAALLERVKDQMSSLFRTAVSLTTGDANFLMEQRTKMLELDAQLEALRRKLKAKHAQVVDRDAKIDEMDLHRLKLEASLMNLRDEMKLLAKARNRALREASHARELKRENEEMRIEHEENVRMVRTPPRSRGLCFTAALACQPAAHPGCTCTRIRPCRLQGVRGCSSSRRRGAAG